MTVLHESGMVRLADDQIAFGTQLQAVHQPHDGLCVDCGRPAPCPAAVRGEQLVTQYRAWLDRHAAATAGTGQRR